MSFRSPQAQPSHRAIVDWNRYSILEEDKFYGARLRAPIRRTSFSGAVPEGRSPYDDLLKPPAQTSDRATADKNHSSTREDKFYGARLRAPFRRTSFSSAVPEGRSHFYKTFSSAMRCFCLVLPWIPGVGQGRPMVQSSGSIPPAWFRGPPDGWD